MALDDGGISREMVGEEYTVGTMSMGLYLESFGRNTREMMETLNEHRY